MFGKAAKFRKVLKRTGIAADDAIAIGDEVRDGEAAAQAGIDFGAVSWGYASPEALQAAFAGAGVRQCGGYCGIV